MSFGAYALISVLLACPKAVSIAVVPFYRLGMYAEVMSIRQRPFTAGRQGHAVIITITSSMYQIVREWLAK